ncbi:MAG: TfoX/Sxy family protein [Paracoccaceae bacterium]
MAYSESVYEAMSLHLGAIPDLSEKRMFGGICFMLHGNMVGGAMKSGAMIRVGKARAADALALPGVEGTSPAGRKMGGMVWLPDAGDETEEILAALIGMALGFVGSLPPKP